MILTPGLIISNNIVIKGGHPTGQAEFTSPGTYSWVAPNGVSQVHVVAVGGGGNGRVLNSYPAGGAGGGLGWKNNIPVNAGTAYTVRVGSAASNSYFINETVVCGFGAIIVSNTNSATQANALGGSFVGDGGGNGGNVGSYTASYRAGINTAYPNGAGAGGAGGYTGPGGDGARGLNTFGPSFGTNGQGGGGGGGNDMYNGGGPGAGGVGIYGIGPSGQSSYPGVLPQGGSNGESGASQTAGPTSSTTGGNGGKYGGGGGGGDGVYSIGGGSGGTGAVRIIWGDNRRFPNINTANILQTFNNI